MNEQNQWFSFSIQLGLFSIYSYQKIATVELVDVVRNTIAVTVPKLTTNSGDLIPTTSGVYLMPCQYTSGNSPRRFISA